MNQQFSNGNPYQRIYAASQDSAPPVSRPPTNSLPQHISQTSQQLLPPLTISAHAYPPYANESHVARSQPPQSSMMTSHPDPIPHTFAPYAPTASTYFSGQTTFAQLAQPHQPIQNPRSPSNSALSLSQTQPLYTTTPPQSRLAPAPPREGKPPLTLGTPGNRVKSEDEPQPTHVVGSQGRRGILPSAAGRPEAVAGANPTTQKGASTPAKDSEGKYPCPHCNKNYLHAKHLKRHLLRRE